MYVPTGKGNKVIPFLISLDDNTNHITTSRLESKNEKQLFYNINNIVKFYNSFNWYVYKIKSDPEGIFKGMKDWLQQKLGIEIELGEVNEHSTTVERMIRVIRERLRININAQSYRVPISLYKYSINKPVSDLNNTPNSKTITVTPNQIVTGNKLDYKYDISLPWGTIVDIKIPMNLNSSESRIESGIVIGNHCKERGTRVISIKDGKFSRPKNRRKIWIKRNDEEIIKIVNDMARIELSNNKGINNIEILTNNQLNEVKGRLFFRGQKNLFF